MVWGGGSEMDNTKKEGQTGGSGLSWRSIAVITAALSLALATSLPAKIGESSDQVLQDAQRDRNTVSIRWGETGGRPTLWVTYRDGSSVAHTFGAEGKEFAQGLFAKRLIQTDIDRIQRDCRKN
jgi:hypothetical protein